MQKQREHFYYPNKILCSIPLGHFIDLYVLFSNLLQAHRRKIRLIEVNA
jgi:hypothetical protein